MHKLVISILGAAFAFLNSTSAMATPQTAPVSNALNTNAYASDVAVLTSYKSDVWQASDAGQPKKTFTNVSSPVDAIAAAERSHNAPAMLAALLIIGSIVVRRFLR